MISLQMVGQKWNGVVDPFRSTRVNFTSLFISLQISWHICTVVQRDHPWSRPFSSDSHHFWWKGCAKLGQLDKDFSASLWVLRCCEFPLIPTPSARRWKFAFKLKTISTSFLFANTGQLSHNSQQHLSFINWLTWNSKTTPNQGRWRSI